MIVKKIRVFSKSSFIAIVWLCLSAAAYGISGTSEEMYKLLFNLKPSPKIHYSGEFWDQFKDCNEQQKRRLAEKACNVIKKKHNIKKLAKGFWDAVDYYKKEGTDYENSSFMPG